MYNTTASVSDYIQFGISTTNSSRTLSNNSVAYFWGAQVNVGTAKPYFPTTDRLNVPRLTYQNGGGGCPSLLLEKQSTNLVTYSQNLTGASWTTVANTLTANYATSPDGTSNATRIIPNTANSTHINYQTFTVSSATSITAFAKADGYNFFQIYGGDASGGPLRYSVVVNLTTGAIDTIDTITSNQVAIVSMGNGWYKITISNFTSFTSGFSFIGIAGIPSSGLSRNANLDVIFAGNGTGGVLAYGIQVEESTYPTSYIPTTSASATRVADLATVNLPNTNMTFTAYLELDEASLGTPAGDWFGIFSNVSALGRAYGYANQFGFADAYSLGVASGTKMVWKQESGSTAKIFKGGALVGTSTTGTYTDPFNRLRMDGALLDKPVKIKQFVYFDNALTDAECIQLTA
jgi:hypothetical protein